jgi:tetratricopeptide (TPR) repeat protein/predicted Ser/Thr protein kinase
VKDLPLHCHTCRHQNRSSAVFCGQCGAQLPIVARRPPPLTGGIRLGPQQRYQVERLLGQGGFGEVYLAYDTTLRRECVVKRLRVGAGGAGDSWLQEHFEREALLLAGLNTPGHPNIPEIYEYLPAEHCLVMKYIAGQSLRALLNGRPDPLPEPAALRIVRDVCSALVYLHDRSPAPVIHRDIKPDNILIGGDGRVWLVDFGLAKGVPPPASSGDPNASGGAGTLGFAPPEQWRGAAEPRSDVFALAMTLATLLTNRLPVDSSLAAGDVLATPASLTMVNPTVRQEVVRLIERALAPSAEVRPTAREFLDGVEVLLAGLDVPPPPEPLRPPSTAGMVERQHELAAYAACLAEHGVAVITGMPGAGKTTLAAMLAAGAGAQGRTFWHTFRPGETLEALAWEFAAFAWWNGRPDLWEQLHRSQRQHSPIPAGVLLDYVSQIVRGRHYLLCLDDAHLAEDDALVAQLVARLVAAAREGELALILTARSTLPFAPPGSAPLPGLRPDEAHALLANQDVALPDELFAALYRRTEGGAQLLALAADALRSGRDPQRLVEDLPTTGGVTNYLLREVDCSLSADERAVMEGVAVLLSYGGTRDAIEALLGGEPAWRTLRALRLRHLLSADDDAGDPVYSQHATVQGLYYGSLGRRERTTLHGRAAAYYAGPGADPLKAARHALLADDHALAADQAVAAVWSAANRGEAPALRQVLEAIEPDRAGEERRVAVQLARGEICALLQDGADAQAHFQEALRLLDLAPDSAFVRERRARACRGMAEAVEYHTPHVAIRWLDQGLDALATRDAPEAAAILIRKGSALIGVGDYPGAQQALASALDNLPETEAEARADALTNLGASLCAQGVVNEGIACYKLALAAYEAAGSAWKLLSVAQNLGIEQVIAGAWDAGEASLRRSLAEAQRLGSVLRQTELALSLGILHTRRGDFETAGALLERAVALAGKHNLHEQLVACLSSLADLQLRTASLEAAAQTLEEAEGRATAIEAFDQLPEIQRGWATLLLARGAVAESLGRAERAAAEAEGLGLDIEHGTALRSCGEALAAAGRHDEAERAFAASVTALNERDPYEAARTRLAWGRARRQRGEDGAALMADGSEVLRQLGVTI